jgi:hypothetical protein
MAGNDGVPHHRPSPISRKLQHELLLLMRDQYPSAMHNIPDFPNIEDRDIFVNLLYLEEHRLCKSGVTIGARGDPQFSGATINASGLDFLEDDGGLSAALGVVTIKVHADTVRDLLASKIDETAIPAEEKSRLKSAIKGLSETALKSGTTELVQTGLQHIPNVVEWLRTIAGL